MTTLWKLGESRMALIFKFSHLKRNLDSVGEERGVRELSEDQ